MSTTKFTDTAGREWTFRIDVEVANRVQAATGVDLYALTATGHPEPMGAFVAMGADASLLTSVLWQCAAKEAAERGVPRTAFWEAFDCETIEAANDAFLEALLCFFAEPRRTALRTLLKTITTRAKVLQTSQATKLTTMLADPEAVKHIDAILLAPPGPEATPTASQEPAESHQAPTPSGS